MNHSGTSDGTSTSLLLKKFRSSYSSAAFEVGRHFSLFLGGLYLLHFFRTSTVLELGFGIPFMTLMIIRTFLILHDCGHSSFFPDKRSNFFLGSVCGSLVFTPFSWCSHHYIHHLVSGNIENEYDDYRWSETIQYTVAEYAALHPVYKRLYRVLRSPVCFFSIMPAFQFFIMFRLSILFESGYNYKWNDTFVDWVINNTGILLFMSAFHYYGILGYYMLAFYFAAVGGFILFHNQHTYNPGYVVPRGGDWSIRESGLKGSSFIDVPWFLKFFTMGIEHHHIHHFLPRIPGYNMAACHNYVAAKWPEFFADVVHLSMRDIFSNLNLVLYSEAKTKFVTFDEADCEIELCKIE
jgi:omega-6 fatty acid desaturase (delta-12 desaturase)